MQPITRIEKEFKKMKNRLSPRTCLKSAALIGMALLLPLTASAQQDGSDTHTPALAAPADVDHLQNQAARTAQQSDPETVAAIRTEMHAGQAVQAAQRNGDDQDLESARANHRAAEMHAEALVARTCETTQEQIAEMRSQGMGWGQIASNMGVHPGTPVTWASTPAPWAWAMMHNPGPEIRRKCARPPRVTRKPAAPQCMAARPAPQA
jgi:hypothetical protein